MNPNPLFDLTGKVALVTGGNGGIGLGIAIGLAQAGAAIAIAARNEDKNHDAIAALEKTGARSLALKLDVTDRAALAPAVEAVERKLGPIDILVNNAGISILRGSLKHDAELWDRVLETNLHSCFFLSQLCARSMISRRVGGKIINVASEYSLFGGAGVVSYAAAKGGLVQMTKSMAIELAPRNIQVNALAPGWIRTDMTIPAQSGPYYQEIITRTPAGRFGEPSDMAGTAVFLAAPASDFMTGAVLFVDGGYAIR